jgi:hypothetical protein
MEYKLIVRMVSDSFLPEEDTTAVERLRGRFAWKVVDADIADFDDYIQDELNKVPLTAAEKATIKRYLGWKLGMPVLC